MSKTRENSGLWRWFRSGTRHLRPLLHMQRVENGVATGTPDVEGFYGKQFWTELKAVDDCGEIDVEVSTEQVVWHNLRHRAGGRSWFLIQVGSGAKARRFLIPGSKAKELHPDKKPWSIRQLHHLSWCQECDDPVKLLKTMTE